MKLQVQWHLTVFAVFFIPVILFSAEIPGRIPAGLYASGQGAPLVLPAPNYFFATPVSNNQINVQWADVEGEDGYVLYVPVVGWLQIYWEVVLPANTTSYLHTGNSPGSQTCYFIYAYNSAGNSNSVGPSCANTFNYSVAVLSPNGGENWARGSVQTITWTDDFPEDVKIELLKSGVVHSTITNSTTSNGSYSWTIPTSLTPGNDYKVRISSISSPGLSDESNAEFEISMATPVSAILGSTRYDLQTNASGQNRLHLYPDGTLAVTYTMGFQETAFADRGTGYNYFDGSSWGASPTARIENVRTGWPSYSPYGANGELVMSHTSDAPSKLMLATRTTKGSGAWSFSELPGLTSTIGVLYPRVVTNGSDHMNIHVIALTTPGPSGGYLVYNRSLNGGVSWSGWQILPGMDSTIYSGFAGDSYSFAQPKGDTLCFTLGTNWCDQILMKSTNNGTSWVKTVIWPSLYNLVTTPPPVDTFFCADIANSVALDNEGNAHVVFGRGKIKSNGSIQGLSISDGLLYWNENMPQLPQSLDSALLVAGGNWLANIPDQSLWTATSTLINYRLALTTMPTMVFDNDNLYVAWSSITTIPDNNGKKLRHIFAKASNNGGMSWCSNTLDLCNVPELSGRECVYPSFASAAGADNLYLVFQHDSLAGTKVNPPGGQLVYNNNQMQFISIPKTNFVFDSLPEQPGEITGDPLPCVGTIQNYSVPNVPGIIYNWTFPSGWTQTEGGTSNSVTVLVGFESGIIQATPSNGCGDGPSRTINAGVLFVPGTPGQIYGQSLYCNVPHTQELKEYSVAPVPGASFYIWYEDGIVIPGQNTETILLPYPSYSYVLSVSAMNGCGDGLSSELPIILIDVVPSITGPEFSCVGSIDTLTTEPNMINYLWTYTGGMVIAGGSYLDNYITIQWNETGPQSVTVDYTDVHGCNAFNPTQHNVLINTALDPVVSITASANPVCGDTLVTFTATTSNAGPEPVYQWKVNGVNVGENLHFYSYLPVNNDAVTCEVTSYGLCTTGATGTSNTIVMVVGMLPTAPVAGTQVPGQTQMFWTWNDVPGATGYKWSQTDDYASATDMGIATVKNETGLTCNTNYIRYVWAYNDCGNSDSTVLTQTTNPCSLCCGEPITDTRDGKLYNTVLIGSQCWLAQNLNVGTRIDGPVNQINNAAIEKYCYDNLDNNCTVYGGLYQWDELMNYSPSGNSNPSGRQGICPTGWHVPADAEWTELTTYLGNEAIAGGSLKEEGFAHWQIPNTGASNSSGFTALPGGTRIMDGSFGNLTTGTSFWSATENSESYSWARELYYNEQLIDRNYGNKSTGYAARCVQDCNTPVVPTGGVHIPSLDQIIWKWNSVPNATGYKWSTTNDYASAIDMGTLTLKTETGLACSNTYTRYLWAYNDCGHTTPTMLIKSTLECVFNCGQTITDSRDNQVYGTVLIGNQCWMSRNLNFGTRIDGTIAQTDNSVPNKYCYSDNEFNCAVYGGLYQWGEFMNYATSSNSNPSGRQGICPIGWHVPGDAEWTQLANHLGGLSVAGGPLKEAGTINWLSPNTGATNTTSFTGLPGGRSLQTGGYENLGFTAAFWSSAESSTVNALNFSLANTSASATLNGASKTHGFSGRCLKNCDPPIAPPSGMHSSTSSQVTWNWSAVSGATGYKWNTTDNYASAIDMGTSTSKIETGLDCITTYSRFVWAYNSCGISTSTILVKTTSACTFTCGQTLTDTRDGQAYNTVSIGTQCWMAENMNVGTMINSSNNQTSGVTIEKYCYNNSEPNCNTYGGLYQWDEMMNYDTSFAANPGGIQGICMPGWHVPSDIEWCQMETFLDATVSCTAIGFRGNNVGSKLKEAGLSHWNSPNSATNSSGFTALPGGHKILPSGFSQLNEYGYFWTANQYSTGNAWMRYLAYNSDKSYRNNTYSKSYGFSLRCIQNCSAPPSPAPGSHTPAPTQIIWNWVNVPGAQGYKWNTTNDYATAIDMGMATTKTETGLTCNTPYTRYVWSYNGCGKSGVTILTQTTTLNPAAGITITPSSYSVCEGTQVTFTAIAVNGGNSPLYTWKVNGSIVGINSPTYTYPPSNNDLILCVLTPDVACNSGNPVNSNTIAMTVTSGLPVTAVVTDALCNQSTDGAINITVSGGTPGYTFLWSNGMTTEDITGLVAGIYSVTIMDVNFCEHFDSWTVNEPGEISWTGDPGYVTCNGYYNGTITTLMIDGGTPPYTYQWEGPVGFTAAEPNLSGLAPGNYFLTITDAHNCKAYGSLVITEPELLAVGLTADITMPLCFGSCDGMISNIVVTGGTPPYTYLWANGATTADVTGLCYGNHSVTVTDANNCATTGSFFVEQPTVVEVIGFSINTKCDLSCDGEIMTITFGGTPPYTYLWSNGAITADITGLCAGSYTITVTDAHNCETNGFWTVGSPDPLSVIAVSTDASCYNYADGSIDITVGGGTPPYTYVWSNGETTQDISGLYADNYCVTITDANLCTTVECWSVWEPSELIISATIGLPQCYNSCNGFFEQDISGGTPPYTYLWSTGATTASLYNLCEGSYGFTVTDAHFCQKWLNLYLTAPSEIMIGEPAVIVDASCIGYCNGSISNLDVTGGVQPYTFLWSNGGTTLDLDGLCKGTYTLTVTDFHNCSSSASYFVDEEPLMPFPVSVSISASENPVCIGTSVIFTATPTNGGASPNYQWKKGVTTISGATNATYNYIPVNGDVITCVLTSNATCSTGSPATSNAITMTVNPILPVSVQISSSSNTVCAGTIVNFTAIPTNGGTTPTYQWKKGGINIPGATNSTYSYTPSNYDVISCLVNSSENCVSGNSSNSNAIVMIVNPNLPVSVSITASTNPVCSGTNVIFTASPTNGGTLPLYQWKKNGLTVFGATASTYSYVPANYDVISCVLASNATCVSGNPANSNAIIMTVNPLLPVSVSINTSTNTLCSGTVATFTATTVNGGSAPTYQWKKGGATISGATNSSFTYIPVNADIIHCDMTSNAQCNSGSPATSNPITMTVNPLQPVSVSILASANPVNTGTMVVYSASGINAGSNPQYHWSVNGSNVGTNSATYSYYPLNNDQVLCELTSSLTCATGSPASSNTITMVVTDINVPLNENLQNVVIPTGEVICYNALQAISVAGDGTTFVIIPGSSATMIAGQNIHYYTGTIILAGGYMHGYISPTGPWCTTPVLPGKITGDAEPAFLGSAPLRLFPNPTNSSFTLSFTREPAGERIDVKIFNMMGELIIQHEIREGTNHEFSLELQSPGIYLVKVDRMGVSETRKIIKQ